MRSRASKAASSSRAATAATGSPTKRTLSRESACSSWETGRMPKGMGSSEPTRVATTPAIACAFRTSTFTMRAWGCGLLKSLQKSIRGSARSSANRVSPLTFAIASTFMLGLPMMVRGSASRAVVFSRGSTSILVGIISALDGDGTPHFAPGGSFDGLEYLEVSGAAAEIARERLLDLFPFRQRVSVEESLRGEKDSRSAVPALRGAHLGESYLERMRPTALGQSLDGEDFRLLELDGKRETGEHRLPVDEHGAGAALAELATVLGPGEPQVLPQDFEKRLVRGNGDLDGLTIDA